MLELIKRTASFIREKVDFKPEVGIILGTGLGGLTQSIEIHSALDYSDIPDFPVVLYLRWPIYTSPTKGKCCAAHSVSDISP